jgi:hypothetical protein
LRSVAEAKGVMREYALCFKPKRPLRPHFFKDYEIMGIIKSTIGKPGCEGTDEGIGARDWVALLSQRKDNVELREAFQGF